MANEQNLNPLGSGKLSPEEEFRIRSLGGKASQEAQRQRKYSQKVKEEFQKLLDMPYRSGDLEEIISLQDVNKNTSVATKLYMKLILDYLNTGNPRLLELIMRYSGGNEEQLSTDAEEPENNLIEALNRQAAEVWSNDHQSKE